MKNTKKWTVERGGVSKHFDEREDVVKYISEAPMRVSNIRHYNKLTSSAIDVFKEGLRLASKPDK